MGKPSNADLIAERKAIRELLDVPDGVATAIAVEQLKSHHNDLKMELRGIKEAGGPPAQPPIYGDGRTQEYHADTGLGPVIDPKDIEKKPTGVAVDTAFYPGFSKQAAPPAANEMSPIQGDLTPNYCRWFLSTNGPAETLKKYGDRVHLLPDDVRRALS